MRLSCKAIKFGDNFTRTKTSFGEKGDKPRTDEGRRRNGCFNTERGNENLTKSIFRVTGGNERSFTLIKPQGNDSVMARSLPPDFMAWLLVVTAHYVVVTGGYSSLPVATARCHSLLVVPTFSM